MPQSTELAAAGLDLFDRHVEISRHDHAGGDFDDGYYLGHRERFARTLSLIPAADGNGSALEIGATAFFQVTLHCLFGYGFVAGTEQNTDISRKLYRKPIRLADLEVENLTLSIDVESDIFPFADGSLDFVMCCEVIEHLDVDPMFMIAEINRVLRPEGRLLLTTPNACSSRSVWKILQGYRPHFHMQYSRSRTPYRHNFEYDVHGLVALADAGGFVVEHLSTHDVFEPPEPAALGILKNQDLPTEYRGDDVFLLLRKQGPVVDRWPSNIYVD